MTDTQGPLRTTVVQFGAGGIGRGFAAPLFCEAGRETLFVDVDADLVAALNERRAYPLALLGPHRREERTVGPVRALHAGDAPAVVRELARCEFAATAVGVGILPRLAATLAAGVRTRRAAGAGPLDVILCENQLHCAEGLWEALRPELTAAEAGSLGLVESAVGRTVPLVSPEQRARDPLWIAADDYPHLIAARAGFRGLVPAVPGLRVVEDLQPYADRKLLGHNMAHAVAAYLGAAAGYETVQAALADHEIAECVGRALDAVAPALARRHGFAPEEMRAWRADLDLRLRNPQLPDAIARVGRDPLRKLGPE
ncbi:MAG: mannitol-1-phosphate 5-dehydrogenase, partial [Armatimonadetes bacterium]|nr:mannitol-1-phosphate 5-dehydrogenase [Armatimonadota bacterium]